MAQVRSARDINRRGKTNNAQRNTNGKDRENKVSKIFIISLLCLTVEFGNDFFSSGMVQIFDALPKQNESI